jgi:hypothetical protein
VNNTTVDVRTESIFHHQLSIQLDSTPKINHKMSASNDELLLFNAAKNDDLDKVKELLSKGTGTGYRDEAS